MKMNARRAEELIVPLKNGTAEGISQHWAARLIEALEYVIENESAQPADITKDDFEQAYAARSGVTVEWLHEHGRFAVPCDCGEDGCNGWKMAHGDDVYTPPPAEARCD